MPETIQFYSVRASCSKCGTRYENISTTYVKGDGRAMGGLNEYMRRKCETCGYVWVEHPLDYGTQKGKSNE